MFYKISTLQNVLICQMSTHDSCAMVLFLHNESFSCHILFFIIEHDDTNTIKTLLSPCFRTHTYEMQLPLGFTLH